MVKGRRPERGNIVALLGAGYRSRMSAVRHASFAPHVAPDTRLLLLGSLPGARSLAEQQYYAHPTNQFWRLLGEVIGQPLAALPYDDRLTVLREAKVGLWDVIRSAERHTSSDSLIREAEAHDLAALMADLPDLRMIAFNGGKAAAIGRRQLPVLEGVALVDLPVGVAIESTPVPLSRASDLQQTAEEVRSFGVRCLTFEADVRDRDAVVSAVDETVAEFGSVDYVAANAGIFSWSRIEDMPEPMWRDMIDVNLTGVFHTFHAVAGHLARQDFGRVVATASMAGRGGFAHLGPQQGGEVEARTGFQHEVDVPAQAQPAQGGPAVDLLDAMARSLKNGNWVKLPAVA